MKIRIGNNIISEKHPTYFIAEVGANHDGDINRAKDLIHLAYSSGANAVKFQNFRAPHIVSDYGFKNLPMKMAHQEKWGKSVFEVYEDASIPFEWTNELSEECNELGLDYFSSPYDFNAVNELEYYFPAIKIGSGDITWLEILRLIASKDKPVLLATGASSFEDVHRAVNTILEINSQLILMQCNTNYSGSNENIKHVNLNVLKTYRALYPNLILGLSDHTLSKSVILGAVSLGARVIERHFTDDRTRQGPDHLFAMEPDEFLEMVELTRELELALGSSNKFVAENEKDIFIIQRRCIRVSRDILAGEEINRDMIDVLRPAPEGSIQPYELEKVIGLKAITKIPQGKEIHWGELSN